MTSSDLKSRYSWFQTISLNDFIGKFNILSSTIASGSAITARKKSKEVFLKIGAGPRFWGYNATIESATHNGDMQIANEKINRIIYNYSLGIFTTLNRWSLGIEYSYSTPGILDNQSHIYAMVSGVYRFD